MYNLDGGVYIGKLFWVFQLFWIISHQYGSKSPTIANFAKKVDSIGSKRPNLVILHDFLSFPPKWSWDWLGIVNFTRFTTFPIFSHQSVSFLEKYQKFSFWGGGCTSANFLMFPNFPNCFRPVWLKSYPQLQIWPKKWLWLGQNGQIWLFCTIFYVFPQSEAEIDSE